MTTADGIDDTLADMTLPEKIGQMTQVSNESISPGEVADHFIGSVLSGGNGNPSPNTPSAWVDMVGSFVEASAETRLGIPLIYGIDAVHGHSSVSGATIFPHNIGLGSAGDVDLVTRIGEATRIEMLATGIRWTFAPTLAVPQDIRWGRTYEGYGRDPDLVSSLGAAMVRGLQGPDPSRPAIFACAKHFVGDGATEWGTAPRLDFVDWWDGWGDGWQIDQGDARISEDALRSMHLRPYVSAVEAGVQTVMASYSSWNGVKLHASKPLLTDVLKDELGFAGFVVSDWMGIDQIDSSYEASVVTAINAGIDMAMVPDEFRRFIDALTTGVSTGQVSMTRIDDAVGRILRAKSALGVSDPEPETPPLAAIGSPEHRALAAEAVRRSAVLLKNDEALPVSSDIAKIDVAGAAAADIGLQCGGWTVGWQGGVGNITSGTTLLDGLRAAFGRQITFSPSGRFTSTERSQLGILCIAEPPYAEGPGDSSEPTATQEDRAVFARMRQRVDKLVLVIYSGRPLIIPDLVEQADAVVAAWLPGTEAAALADSLLGLHPFQARSSQPWPKSAGDLGNPDVRPMYALGHGLVSHGAIDGGSTFHAGAPGTGDKGGRQHDAGRA